MKLAKDFEIKTKSLNDCLTLNIESNFLFKKKQKLII